MKYRKNPILVEAAQWFKNGDHPEDGDERFTTGDFAGEKLEGKVVRFFRRPDVAAETICKHCDKPMNAHGWIDTLEGGHIVCPGDWIITGVKGEHYPCKPDIFEATYEAVTDHNKENNTEELYNFAWNSAWGTAIEVVESMVLAKRGQWGKGYCCSPAKARAAEDILNALQTLKLPRPKHLRVSEEKP